MDWLDGFSGFLHTDAQNIFDDLDNKKNEENNSKINLVYCNAHSRKKFEQIAQGAKGDGLAKQALRFYRKIYKIERELKDQLDPKPYRGCKGFKGLKEFTSLSTEEFYQLRYKTRLEQSKPVMEEFKAWLDQHYPTVLPKSPLGKAFAYAIKHWPGLSRFFEDGRLEVDNNLTEQQIKPVVIARKNFLFCKSIVGVKAVCNHMSLIRTAIVHDLDPYSYILEILEKIPNRQKLEHYEALLTWRVKLNKHTKKTKYKKYSAKN